MEINKELFPKIAEVVETLAAVLDVTLLKGPDVLAVDEHTHVVASLYWLGSTGDKAAGIHEVAVTPTFTSPRELEQFCAQHLANYRSISEQGSLPNYFFWQTRSRAELHGLKLNWENDPCWDLETSDGFEAHHDELLIHSLQFQKSHLERQNKEQHDALAAIAKLLFPHLQRSVTELIEEALDKREAQAEKEAARAQRIY